ncbi:MAG TPA: methyltransferase domain-containing protein [Candidatus Eremiobacteraeota bacterium]|nr:MAG: Glycine/sarcosine N-methyltransferase [bacterium ADurb.Bin363]HPZ08948.1 methyltransferase domain-containing protein [Candidatus Eremiobacteraeota bacterium]
MEFYERLEEHYDKMIRFKERLDKERLMLQKWLERYKFQSVVDVGCGTGLHAILLSQMGINVTGVDISETMLKQARLHAGEMGVEVTWLLSSMVELKKNLNSSYDAVFCLGNSIPHLLDKIAFEETFQGFYDILIPGGLLVIQLLNYYKVYATGNRIVGIHREKDTEYIRFYDLYPSLKFNILIVTWDGDSPHHSLQSTELYPYRKEEIEISLLKVGFTEIEYYGDMHFHPFDENTSSNLVVIAKKAR